MCGVPRKPAKAAKTGLDARRGPASWERPADGGNASLRHACAHRAPGGSRHAPDDGRVLSLPNRKYLLIRRISMTAAPAATRLQRLFGTSRPNFARAMLFDSIRVPTNSRAALRKTTVEDAGSHALQPIINAHDGRVGRGLPNKLPITPSSSHVETAPPPHANNQSTARLQVQCELRQRDEHARER